MAQPVWRPKATKSVCWPTAILPRTRDPAALCQSVVTAAVSRRWREPGLGVVWASMDLSWSPAGVSPALWVSPPLPSRAQADQGEVPGQTSRRRDPRVGGAGFRRVDPAPAPKTVPGLRREEVSCSARAQRRIWAGWGRRRFFRRASRQIVEPRRDPWAGRRGVERRRDPWAGHRGGGRRRDPWVGHRAGGRYRDPREGRRLSTRLAGEPLRGAPEGQKSVARPRGRPGGRWAGELSRGRRGDRWAAEPPRARPEDLPRKVALAVLPGRRSCKIGRRGRRPLGGCQRRPVVL